MGRCAAILLAGLVCAACLGRSLAVHGCDLECGHGVCDDSIGAPACVCDVGWSGPGCAACRFYVNAGSTAAEPDGADWAGAFPKVQQGIDAALPLAPGETCEVWVASGRYAVFEGAATDTVQLAPGIHLHGGLAVGATSVTALGAEESVFDGGQAVEHVVTGASDALLSNVRVEYGTSGSFGAGLYNVGVTNFLVRDVDFAFHAGGAIYNEASEVSYVGLTEHLNAGERGSAMANVDSTVTVEGATINWHTSDPGGGVVWNDATSNLVLRDSYVVQNTDQALRNAGTALVDGCQFIDNNGSQGAAIWSSGPLTVLASVFAGNSASGDGGAIHIEADAEVINSIFAGNNAASRAAVSVTGGTLTLLASTLWGNRATDGVGAVVAHGGGRVELRGSMAWWNFPDNIGVTDGGSLHVEYSNVQASSSCVPCTFGAGNIDLNPDTIPGLAGTWTETPNTVGTTTTYRDTNAAWSQGQLRGLFIRPNNVGTSDLYPIFANTANTVTILGTYGGLVSMGDSYEIVDFHLKHDSSPCVDAAAHDARVTVDLEGRPRAPISASPPSGDAGAPSYPDMGALEAVVP